MRDSKQILRNGDILVSTANSKALVGKSALVTSVPFEATFGAFVTVLRPESGIDPEYLAYWMRTPDFMKQASALASQTTNIANLGVRDLLDVRLPVIEGQQQQRRIVAELSNQLSVAEELTDRVEAARGGSGSLPGLLRAASFDRLDAPRERLGQVIATAGAIIDGPFGSHLKTDHYRPKGIRVIRLGNIGVGSFIDADQVYVSNEHFATLSRHAATAGDIVVAALGDGARPAGRACMVPDWIETAVVKADCF